MHDQDSVSVAHGDRDAYIGGLKCTEGEFKAVREDMALGKRRFLLKRESGSVICEFDLGDLREYVAVLSDAPIRCGSPRSCVANWAKNPPPGWVRSWPATTKPATETKERSQ